jgi:hypothetical protein
MSASRSRLVLFVLAAVLATICTWAWARSSAPPVQQAATLRLDTSRPGAYFQTGAIGLSTEASELETDHLDARHTRLVEMMRSMGRSVLRIAGGSVDNSWWTSRGEAPPSWATNTVTPEDLSAVSRLLAATKWRVLLGLDLGHFEPARAASEARYAEQILGSRLMGVEIGNEPNSYGHPRVGLRASAYGASEYVGEIAAYRSSLRAAAPGLRIYGPDLTQSMTWLPEITPALREFDEITQHFYATSTCPEPSIAASQKSAELLSPEVRQREGAFLETLADVRQAAGRPTRVGETNADSCTSPTPEPTFASALWSLDWVLRAVSSGVSALNFHTRLHACSFLESPICASSEDAANAGSVTAQPVYYGLLAARELEGGRFIPALLETSSAPPDLTTWATVMPGGTIKIALDYLAAGGPVQTVSIPAAGYEATAQILAAPSVEASSGVKLGGTSVTERGHWRPRRVRARRVRSLRLLLSPGTAQIVTLRPRRRERQAPRSG